MPKIEILSNDIMTFTGIRGSGKTQALTRVHHSIHEATSTKILSVMIATKGDDNTDIKLWHDFGYEIMEPQNLSNHRTGLVCVLIRKKDIAPLKTKEVAQRILAWCNEREDCNVGIDEFSQIKDSDRDSGEDVKYLIDQGRGLGLGGLFGMQHFAYNPRDPIEQAQHRFIFRCPGPKDIKMIREDYYKDYTLPRDEHGFWYQYVNAKDSKWRYFPNIQTFLKRVTFRKYR